MKITCIKTFVCDAYRTNFIFVRIDTDEGVHGVGEATMSFGENAAVGCIKDLEPGFIGQDPLAIDRLWHDNYRDSYWRGGPVLMSALSGLEMACWDIKGKVLKQPLWQLLGGKFRDRVPCYANAWFVLARTPAEFAAKAREAAQAGWKALNLPAQPGRPDHQRRHPAGSRRRAQLLPHGNHGDRRALAEGRHHRATADGGRRHAGPRQAWARDRYL
jgi:L-alanine-DL-glutamate epimerase-like enolase superfamily enzyme